MKNTLAMVQAVVTQSLRNAASLEDAAHLATERIQALGRAQDMLTDSNWETAEMRDVVSAAIAPHVDGRDRFTVDGPSTELSAQQALGIALAIHELATNAVKYGAFSNETGRVIIEWFVNVKRELAFLWRETGGPEVEKPASNGFGTRLTVRVVPGYFSGKASLDYRRSGIEYHLEGTL